MDRYTVSQVNSWITDAEELDADADLVILYFGDHDPDGWQIPRSMAESIGRLCAVRGSDVADRLSYVDEHCTTNVWELDALDPRTLRDLVREEVALRFDTRIADNNEEAVRKARADLAEMARVHLPELGQ